MDGFERLEADRPEFESKEERDSYIDGKKRSYFPLMEQQRRHRISTTVITLLSLFVLVSISGIFWLKFYLVHVKHSESGALITDICNAIFIQVFDHLKRKHAPFVMLVRAHSTPGRLR